MIDFLSQIDKSIFLFLNGLHTPSLNGLMTIVSGQLIWIPFIGWSLYLIYKTVDKKLFYIFLLLTILAIIGADATSSYVLKNLTARLRPCKVIELKSIIYHFGQKCGGKYGFVSSHAANSVVLTFLIIKVLSIKFPKIYLLLIIPALISYSRIYLGVHYPGDIIGGLIVGFLWGILSWKVFESYRLRCQST